MFVMLANVSCLESPRNGLAPLSKMYVMTPMLHMSVAVDIGWYWMISGATNSGVPYVSMTFSPAFSLRDMPNRNKDPAETLDNKTRFGFDRQSIGENDLVVKFGVEKLGKIILEPTALVSDAAFAIVNGFSKALPNNIEYQEIMCWFHMKKKVEDRFCRVNDKDLAKELILDIEYIQISPTQPSISLNLWTNSYQWAKESKEIKILDDKFYIPSDDFNKITDSEFKQKK
ncbi:hypothetical protein BpHYR1_012525 [Brachionus plicatilis]|uniref:MULE transposase domain-containing protein n=1 Tax=Brachionus plicatilis TaxID=10195 RepID=A0A3M7SD52_BRAPC|nr:hypothetical protein BpHYR1_012525 [Brachionus plicatilis]